VIIPLAVVLLLYAAMLVLNERMNLFGDHFPSKGAKIGAYIWLGIFMLGLTVLIAASAKAQPTAAQIARIRFYSVFDLHLILIAFLAGWWLLAGRPPLLRFLNIQRDNRGEAVLSGFAVGVAGWIFTIALAASIALLLRASGLMPKDPKVPPMVIWIAKLAIWKKALLVLAAMTVEEAFYRGWLQKRVGLIASTALFAISHAGYGQPFFLIGVTLISLVIGFTFYRTKNLIPGIIAHGVFDAVQLFVLVPIAFKASGLGG
jgi:membrane protease YdiL (CAAX protease family)